MILRTETSTQEAGLTLWLRKACSADSALLFEWANDPDVRQNSLQSAPILWETHVAWFAHKLADPDCLHLIGEDSAGHPVGQIRFDIRNRAISENRQNREAEISISLAQNQRGTGRGVRLIVQGITILFQTTNVLRAHAWVRTDNAASQRAFLRAGFCDAGREMKAGLSLDHYICCKSP